MQRLSSCYSNTRNFQPFAEPKQFTFDVIVPNNSVLGTSPLQDPHQTNSGYLSECEKDQDSTNHSSSSKDSKENTRTVQKKRPLVVNGVVVDNYMFSDNLNECVDFLLRKHKAQNLNIKAIIRHNSSAKSKEKRKRLRKNKE